VQVIDLETLMDRLGAAPGRAESLMHLEIVAPRAGREAGWPLWLGDPVRAAFERVGVPTPWTHQRAAADLVHGGQHTVVSTGTASGKSLCFNLPALDVLCRDARARALYL
jgi:DEAD/DEAH box helicase domain-containing protein